MIASAALKAKIMTLEAKKERPVLDPRFRQDPATSTVTFARTFGWASQVLGISCPALYVPVWDYEQMKSYLRGKFKIVRAAGGLVRKKDKFLMIYRMKKWDLPKGKKERKEKYKVTAVREVLEECNVTVKIGKKLCTTWHTYTMNKNSMLKKTRWYIMDVVDDSKMKPSIEEDIEDLKWMNPKEVYHALQHSYKSIHYVFEQYYQLSKIKSEL
jgi:ADP-ribose pyrophosphatase YjhB (NUDIX family)